MGWINFLQGVHYRLSQYLYQRRREPNVGIEPTVVVKIALVCRLSFLMTMFAFFSGDSILLSLSKAKKIGPKDYPRLYNVVEEMKIASGLEKMPDVYIIDDKAMNAFATGRDPNKASVAITTGLLEKLNRDELQGVIAHEMAHIRNRDVLLMAITAVMLGTIVILAWWVSRILFFGSMGRSRSSSSGVGPSNPASFRRSEGPRTRTFPISPPASSPSTGLCGFGESRRC